MGIEIRSSQVSVGIVGIEDGKAAKISRVPFEPAKGMTAEEYRQLLQQVLSKAIAEAAPLDGWKGVVGCSLTRNVVKGLGYLGDEASLPEALSLMLARVQKRKVVPTFVHTMDLVEAAGYAEEALALEATGRNKVWRQQVLVLTLGANWGAVLFNDGKRIRRSGLSTVIDPWESSGGSPPWDRLPFPGDEGWAEYIRLADDYVSQLLELATPDHVIMMPTGAAATRPERLDFEGFLPLLTKTKAFAKSHGITLVGSVSPGDAIVNGAALSALVELRLVRARLAVRRAVEGAQSVDRLTPAQLRAVFDFFDTDSSGGLSKAEIDYFLQALGVNKDLDDVFDNDFKREMTFDEFCGWWRKRILEARVLSLNSVQDMQEIISKPLSEIPGDFGPYVVAEVTFSFCRACKAFSRKYEKLASNYKGVRFLSVVANHNRETLDWVKNRSITKAPAFLLYRRGTTDLSEPIAAWSGSSVSRFQQQLEAVLET